ncbi:MAG TPA: hypothetical protein PKW95_13060 [bacterium]|nr:hypothetical protein [bacterium]
MIFPKRSTAWLDAATGSFLHKRGKDVAVLVPLEDLTMLEELEDKLDVLDALQAEAEAAAKGEKTIPWERAKKELGL